MKSTTIENFIKEANSWFNSFNYDKLNKERPEEGFLFKFNDLVSYKEASNDQKKEIIDYISKRAARNIYKSGYKFHFDTEKLALVFEDVSVGTIRFFNGHNRPYARVSFKNGIYPAVPVKYARKIERYDTGRTFDLAVKDLEDFIYYSRVRDHSGIHKLNPENFLFDKTGLPFFYQVGDTYFTKLTPAAMTRIANAYEITVAKCYPNVNSSENAFGLILPFWTNTLFSKEDSKLHVETDEFEKEDIEFFMNNKQIPDSMKAEFSNAFKRAAITEDELNDIVQKADAFIDDVNQVMTENKTELLRTTVESLTDEKYPDATDDDYINILKKLDPMMGFDCGFIYFYPTAEDMKKTFFFAGKSSSWKYHSDGTFSLDFPFFVQSTTIKRTFADKLSSLLKEKGIGLGYHTVLD